MEKNINYIWYSGLEEPDEQREILVEYVREDVTKHEVVYYHDVAYYHKDTDSFCKDTFIINDVIKWCYLDELIKLIGKPSLENHYVNEENNDERLRKTTISFLKDFADKGYENAVECIDWLEKQGESDETKAKMFLINKGYPIDANGGFPTYEEIYDIIRMGLEHQSEQKPFDYENANIKQKDFAPKIGPKFNVGDMITHNTANFIFKIINVGSNGYEVVNKENYKKTISFDNEDNYHLWNISDARDGDVLCTYECDEPKIVFIIKGTPKKHYALSYHCYYNIMYPHFGSDSEKGCLAPNDEDIKPATKEQRDTLFAKIKEAGYEFDFDKKELKKIHVIDEGKSESEQKLANSTKTFKDEDTLLSLLQQMPSCITVDGIDYHFVLKKTIAYMIFYEGEGEGSGKVIFWMAGEPIDICKEMFKRLEKEGLI